MKRKLTIWLGAVAIATLALRFAPLPPIPRETTPVILDRNGVVLYEPLGSGGTRSAWMSEIPHNVARATIAAEDKRFYLHPGIDPIAIARAVVHDVRHLRIVEGGSTITQQVAKLMLQRRSRWQKLHETVVALQLEARYSKKEILALYLNLAPYGEQTIGIARASQRYFGCDPEQLTVAQAAYLAALPQRPSAKNVRYREVLKRMHASYADFAEKLSLDKGKHPLLAPHFVERVLAEGAPHPAFGHPLPASGERDGEAGVRGAILTDFLNDDFSDTILYICDAEFSERAKDPAVIANLRKAKFLIVHSWDANHPLNDFADVLLPACIHAEKDGTFTNLQGTAQEIHQAYSPKGQALTDVEIFRRIGERLFPAQFREDAA